jgi:hypothetical protein
LRPNPRTGERGLEAAPSHPIDFGASGHPEGIPGLASGAVKAIARGVAAQFGIEIVHLPAQELPRHLKAWGVAAGLTLADVSLRCGIDQPALSRLENGYTRNPTLDTLRCYATAVGQRLVLSTDDIRDVRPSDAGRTVPKQGGVRKKKAP